MLKIKGQFNTADVMIDHVDEATLKQIKTMVDHPAFADSHIAVMPDCHAGAGTVIGFTMKMNDKVIPNVIGVDIGCGIESYRLGDRKADFEKFDLFIRQNIPSGFEKRRENPMKDYDSWYDRGFEKALRKLAAKLGLPEQTVFHSIGTLGGGNHFIELDRDDQGELYLTLHSGSRNFGLQVATYHQKKARSFIKKEGIFCPGGLEYLPMDSGGNEYLEDMCVAQRYAALNRHVMTKIILSEFFHQEMEKTQSVKSVHNYINFDDSIIRKGAISAHQGEQLVIPLNMRDGVILGRGKGAAFWNLSAPHGAGRVLSRHQAREKITLEEFQLSMKGIWSSSIRKGTLDESPFAYKPTKLILETVRDSIDIEKILKPVYNFKAED